MTKQTLFILALLLAMAATGKAPAATGDAGSCAQRFFYGGNIGMVFSDDHTRLSAAPLAGFRIFPDWSAGLQLALEYYAYDYLLNGQTATAKSYGIGGGLFTRYELPISFLRQAGSGLYAHAEYDYMHHRWHYNGNQPDRNNNRQSLLVGAGAYIPLGGRSRIALTALWELWHSDSAPYSSAPVIRIGIQF
ncbi:MAG: hypothetical protein LBS12_06445 [Prevotellaceae bacterium]|jgi:hypothetical protein|nr:hypothetical protein [Prevotellaceae bacterium]